MASIHFHGSFYSTYLFSGLDFLTCTSNIFREVSYMYTHSYISAQVEFIFSFLVRCFYAIIISKIVISFLLKMESLLSFTPNMITCLVLYFLQTLPKPTILLTICTLDPILVLSIIILNMFACISRYFTMLVSTPNHKVHVLLKRG